MSNWHSIFKVDQSKPANHVTFGPACPSNLSLWHSSLSIAISSQGSRSINVHQAYQGTFGPTYKIVYHQMCLIRSRWNRYFQYQIGMFKVKLICSRSIIVQTSILWHIHLYLSENFYFTTRTRIVPNVRV